MGCFFDDLGRIRVLEVERYNETQELREECKEFVDRINQFQEITGGFIDIVEKLAQEVDREKLKAIGSRNLLKSIAKQREAQQLQYHALIVEKEIELERLRAQYESLNKIKGDQEEFTEHFTMQK
eukprot:Opistho-2@21549